jgi:hypothetical protein
MASTDTATAVPASDPHELFPLPLTPFEAYMVADDQPDYPMTFVVQLQFDGRADRETFTAALAIALARNPLLTARLTPADGKDPNWVAGDQTAVLDFDTNDTPLTGGCCRPIDLHFDSGLRSWVRTGDDVSSMTFQFHHACCDGVGAFHFIEDLLVAYAHQHDDRGPALRPLDVTRLARRGEFDIPHRSFVERLYDTWVTIRESSKFFLSGTQPLAAPSDIAEPVATDDEGYLQHRFAPDISKRLRQAARRQGVSLNDLLLRDLFLVVRNWNRQHTEKPRRGPLRINMPASLRSRDERTLPAANRMSFAFPARKTSACDSPDELLQSIREETRVTVRDRLTLYFIGILAAANSFGVLRRSLRGNRCFATAVLTNMGDPTRRFVAQLPRRDGLVVAGDLTLTNNSGVPPIRHLTRAVFSLGDYGKRLTISLRCDPRSFSPADTRRLLEKYTRQLAKSAE